MILPEEWRPIPGFEGRYEVSDLGRVRAVWQKSKDRRGNILSASLRGPERRRYPGVNLRRDGKYHSFLVHTIVMLAFEGPPPDGHEIDHLDNDPLNPRYSNLEYVTRSEQLRRSYQRDGRRPTDRVGEKNACARLTWTAVLEIRRLVASGCKQVDVAMQFSVDPSTIAHIVAGRLWRDRRVVA